MDFWIKFPAKEIKEKFRGKIQNLTEDELQTVVDDNLDKIMEEAERLKRYNRNRGKVTAREISTAICLYIPPGFTLPSQPSQVLIRMRT